MTRTAIYQPDLAWIHHVGFGDFARNSGVELLRMLRRRGVTGRTLLDLGCGSGIWAGLAQAAGFRVVGVDSSAAMIALAKRESPKSKFILGSLADCALPPCDVVTAIGEAFSYCGGGRATDLRRLFRRVSMALRPGGQFIFDLILHEGAPMNQRTWRAGRDWAVLAEASEDRKRRQLTRRIIAFRKVGGRIRRSEEQHTVHCFRRKEVERALRAAGFSFEVSRRYGRTPLLTRRLAFVAKKSVQIRMVTNWKRGV